MVLLGHHKSGFDEVMGMKIVLLADPHGNMPATEAMEKKLENYFLIRVLKIHLGFYKIIIK